LNNPFALLILAPVTVAATALATPQRDVDRGLPRCSPPRWHCAPAAALPTAPPAMPPILIHAGTWTALVIGVMFLAGYARQVSNETRACPRRIWPRRWRWRANRT
jgi:two-component system sensor histidine kinase RegB